MKFNTVRAWKDEAYRLSLSEEERNQLPESPVGECELSDAELEDIHGGHGGHGDEGGNGGAGLFSIIICQSVTVIGSACS